MQLIGCLIFYNRQGVGKNYDFLRFLVTKSSFKFLKLLR